MGTFTLARRLPRRSQGQVPRASLDVVRSLFFDVCRVNGPAVSFAQSHITVASPVTRVVPLQRGHGSPPFHGLTRCVDPRLRGHRSGDAGASVFQGVFEVTTSKSCLHFAHAMVCVAKVKPQSGPPDTSASYAHASHRNRKCWPMSRACARRPDPTDGADRTG
jgi:hypothetical protein